MSLILNESGILSDNIHDGDLDETGSLFGRVQRSNRRVTLFEKLKEYVDDLRKAGIVGWLIVDGSFVKGCVDEPEDIDVVLVLRKDWDLTADLRPFQYNLISKLYWFTVNWRIGCGELVTVTDWDLSLAV